MTYTSAAYAREGVDAGSESAFTKLVPAAQVESQAKVQYEQLLNEARANRALAGGTQPMYVRVNAISRRLIPHAAARNNRAQNWRWEINVIGSNTVNAFCMPGGKIAVYSGLIQQLNLTDDELAMVIGHEMTHAVLEHAREQMGKGEITQGAAVLGGIVVANVLGISPRVTEMVARGGSELLMLKFSRQDETQADLVGMEIAARAGFDPRAALSLWQKMSQLDPNGSNAWLSTHPANSTRIKDIRSNLDKVMPLYLRTKR
jgi:predicted Zn-dependent protease